MRGCGTLFGVTHSLQAVTKVIANKFFESFREATSNFSMANEPGVSRERKRPEFPQAKLIFLKGLILAQNERWRRGLGMQVERIPRGLLLGESGERGSKAWVTYPGDRDSSSNEEVIPGDVA